MMFDQRGQNSIDVPRVSILPQTVDSRRERRTATLNRREYATGQDEIRLFLIEP